LEEGVAPKPINAEKAPLSPLFSADGDASLLRPLGLPKPKAVGCTDLTHLEAVGNPLSDGLRLGPPKPIFTEASIGGKPACGRGFRIHDLTRSSHVSSLMWREISRGGASLSSKCVARGSSA
jgi:hypothetical protein